MNYRKIIKPICDFIFSLIAFIILLPVFLTIVFILLIANKGKPFFFQPRPGLHGEIFNVIKFKTMTDKKDIDGKLLSDDRRMTRVGSFIRKTSLDEIPQLLNVIKGNMSLIGPRPLLVEYLSLYDNFQRKRHEVKPGITGWAQVNGRNTICWEQKFEYDVWYVNNLSFALDIKIFFLTLKKVFKTEGISSQTSKTMEKFSGNQL
jgi:lipopolysaccharide/colanic/teichoic acid biosynthesis glycosyltransferase